MRLSPPGEEFLRLAAGHTIVPVWADVLGDTVTAAIALRTMVAAGGKAWVQAGAGVVADSRPQREYGECRAQAAAVLAAIAAAGDV